MNVINFQSTTGAMLFTEMDIIKIVANVVKAQTSDCDFRLFLKTPQSKKENKILFSMQFVFINSVLYHYCLSPFKTIYAIYATRNFCFSLEKKCYSSPLTAVFGQCR